MANDNGSILQDGDGNVYFIPAEDLAGYQLSGRAAESLTSELSKLDDDVAGFQFKPGVPMRPGISALRAFSTPPSLKMPQRPDDDSATVVQT